MRLFPALIAPGMIGAMFTSLFVRLWKTISSATWKVKLQVVHFVHHETYRYNSKAYTYLRIILTCTNLKKKTFIIVKNRISAEGRLEGTFYTKVISFT